MSQNTELKQEPQAPIDWKPLDEVTRQWAVMSQFENDQDWYKRMKEYYE
jgi:hypothetical protein